MWWKCLKCSLCNIYIFFHWIWGVMWPGCVLKRLGKHTVCLFFLRGRGIWNSLLAAIRHIHFSFSKLICWPTWNDFLFAPCSLSTSRRRCFGLVFVVFFHVRSCVTGVSSSSSVPIATLFSPCPIILAVCLNN